MDKIKRSYLLAGLSGLLLGLAYPGWSFDFGFLAWIGLVPLFLSLILFARESDSFTMRNGFWIGFTAGLVYFLIIFRWFMSIYPLDTLGIQNKFLSFIIVILVYLISSAGMATFWGFWSVTVCSLTRTTKKYKLRPWLRILVILIRLPTTFIIFEYLSSWGFGFLWAGSSSLFGPHWTFGNLAYSLVNNPLTLRIAHLGSIYSISFLIILINYLICWLIKDGFSQKTARTVIAIFIFITIAFGHKFIKLPTAPKEGAKKLNFAIIQTAQPTKLSPSPQETIAGLKEQLELLNRVAKEHPESEIIVFPEASDFFKDLSLFLTSKQAQNYFFKLFKESRLVISGGRVLDTTTSRAYSRIFALDTRGDIRSPYDKRLLAPGGEFLPYPIKLLVYLFSKVAGSRFDGLHELNVGAKNVSTINFKNQFKVAPMICSELLSPSLTRQTTQDSDVIISMASYGIFHSNHTIADQMLAATKFRAVELGKPIIMASNLGRSYVIDDQGNIIFFAPNTLPQILTGTLVLNRQK